MLKYKLNNYYNVADYDSNYLENYLRAIGVTKIESFLSAPTFEDELDPYLLENMGLGIELLHKHIENNSKIFLLVDCDPDGYTSGAIFYNYCKNIAPRLQIEYGLHNGKEHGVEEGITIPDDCDLVVIPDAGSSQEEELTNITNSGKEILVLDHHELDRIINNPSICIINNQASPRFSNKALSGAGVVFKFIRAYDEKYETGYYWTKYYDLAMLGCISDVMSGIPLDNNYIFYTGLHNIYNKFFKALLNKQAYSISSTTVPTKIDIAFYITPVINGVIRVGTQEEKDRLFRALANNDIDETVTTTYRGNTRHETFYEFVARESVNIKSRQDALITRTTESIFKKIEQERLNEHKIIIYKTSKTNKNEVPQVLTGLIAMKILAKYNKPALVLRPQLIDGVQYYMGSGRGKNADGFNSLRDFLLESQLVEYSSGHPHAHGVGIKEENIEKLIEYADTHLKDIDFGSSSVEVCGINTKPDILKCFAEHKEIYGTAIPEPTWAFSGVISNFTVMGSRADTVKVLMNGILFIKFHAKELIEELQKCGNIIYMDIVGRAQNNTFMGNTTLQIIIDDYNVRPHSLI